MLPRRSKISFVTPSARSDASALRNSSKVVRANCPSLTYPTPSAMRKADSMLLMGMTPRTTSTSTRSEMPCRSRPRRTVVPRGPRSILTTLFWGILRPATSESPISTMRSPALTPALSLGPCGMTFSTMTVSVAMLKTTPMPSNSPSRGSFRACISAAGI